MTDAPHVAGDAAIEPRSDRRENLARLLVRTFDAMERDILRGFEARGIRLRKTWLPVLRNVEVAGSNITEIAEAAGLSKQTVGPLVRELVDEGILAIEPHPDDGRAKLVRYTPAGLEGLGAGLEVIRSVEARYAEAIGERRWEELRRGLLDLLARFE